MRRSRTGMVNAGSVLLMRPRGTEAAMLGNGLWCLAAWDLSPCVNVLHTTQMTEHSITNTENTVTLSLSAKLTNLNNYNQW